MLYTLQPGTHDRSHTHVSRVATAHGVVDSSYRPTIMEPHYLSLLYHVCYLPPSMWVTHCSPSQLVSILPFLFYFDSLPLYLLCIVSFHILPLSSFRFIPFFARVSLSCYRPRFVARLEAVSLGIYLATFVERMLPLARVQPSFSRFA